MRIDHLLAAGLMLAVFQSELLSQQAAAEHSAPAVVADDPALARQVSLSVKEIVVAPQSDSKLRSGPVSAVEQRLEEMTKAGVAKVLEDFDLTTLSETNVETQVGAKVPIVSGRTTQRGTALKSYNYENVGVLLACNPHVTDNAVLLDLTYERTELVQGSEEGEPPMSVATRVRGILRIPTGKTIVLGGRRIGPDNKTVKWKLLVTAGVIED